jgi:hypothetical protein
MNSSSLMVSFIYQICCTFVGASLCSCSGQSWSWIIVIVIVIIIIIIAVPGFLQVQCRFLLLAFVARRLFKPCCLDSHASNPAFS